MTNNIRLSERQYYQNKFELVKSNINKTWLILKAVINPNNLSKTNIDEIIANDSVITDKSIIVNKFHEYFVKVGQTQAANIPPVPGDVTSYMLNNYPNSMCVDHTNINEISNIIASLKSGNSKGSDGVSSALIKILPAEIAIPLTSIFNISITSSISRQLKNCKDMSNLQM